MWIRCARYVQQVIETSPGPGPGTDPARPQPEAQLSCCYLLLLQVATVNWLMNCQNRCHCSYATGAYWTMCSRRWTWHSTHWACSMCCWASCIVPALPIQSPRRSYNCCGSLCSAAMWINCATLSAPVSSWSLYLVGFLVLISLSFVAVYETCHLFTDYLVQKNLSILGIKVLSRAIEQIRQMDTQLTPIHADLCQLSLKAKHFNVVLAYLDVDITDISTVAAECKQQQQQQHTLVSKNASHRQLFVSAYVWTGLTSALFPFAGCQQRCKVLFAVLLLRWHGLHCSEEIRASLVLLWGVHHHARHGHVPHHAGGVQKVSHGFTHRRGQGRQEIKPTLYSLIHCYLLLLCRSRLYQRTRRRLDAW